MRAKVLELGDSIAVPIPRELVFASPVRDVDVQRVGDTWVIRPVPSARLPGLADALAAFPPSFMAAGREPSEQADRPWDPPATR